MKSSLFTAENVCMDVWLEITRHLDTLSIHNLMLSSPGMYCMYKHNECHVEYILLQKSLDELGVNQFIIREVIKLYPTLSMSLKSDLCKFMQKMNRYFLPHLDSSISELLAYVVESNATLEIATVIFEVFTQKVRLAKANNGIPKGSSLDVITYEDAVYLITHSHPSLISYILRCGTLPPDVIVDIVTTETSTNVRELIKYFFVKHCVRRFYNQGVFELNRMVKYFIHKNQSLNLYYTLSLKDRYVRGNQSSPLNYNACINAAIRGDNLEIVRMLFDDLHRVSSPQQIPLLISPDSIEMMMSKGRFECLEYLVREQIGDILNRYAQSILCGLLKINKRNNIDWSKLDVLNHVFKTSPLIDNLERCGF